MDGDPSAAEVELLKTRDSSLARRSAAGESRTPTGAIEAETGDAMFRSAKSGSKLEPRLSDPLEPADSLTPVEWEREPILNLVTAVLSNCVLGFPFVFKACGLGLAVLLVLVTLIAAELSMRLLLMSSQLTGKRSYEELARHAYGRGGHLAVQCSLVAMNVGSVVSYLLILTDTVSSVAGTVIPPGAEPSRNMMLGLITMCGCLPVALFVKSAQLLSAVNSVSMAFLLFFCCIIALLPFSPTYTGQLVWWRWEGVLVSFPIVSYGFTAHQYLFKIYPASQRPTMKKMTTAVQRGMILSAAIYVAVGACGYSAFGSRTAGDVLRNFGGVGASGMRLHAERVLKYGFGLSLLGTIPLTLFPLHDTFAPWLTLCSPTYSAAAKQAELAGLSLADGVPLSQLQDSLLTTGILGASYALAVLLPNVEFVFGLAGSTASTLMAFILPAAIFLNVSGGQRGMGGHSVVMLRGSSVWRQRRRMAGALLFFGCVAGVLCTHALVVSIAEEKEVVQLAQELVREEAKVAVAAHTEAKAKQVAEVVAEVARAKQEVAVVKAEASGQAETLVRTAQALNSSVAMGGWRNRQEEKGKATTELVQAHSRVDQQVQKLENVTASLGATALRMRNETATSKATAKAAGSYIATAQHQQQEKDDAQQAQQQQQTEAAQQQQQQQEETAEQQHEASAGGGVGGGEGNGGSTAHEGVVRAAEKAVATLVGGEASTAAGKGGGAASAAHEGVVRAAEAAVATLVQKTRQQALPEGGKAGSSSGSGGDDDAAEALEKVAGAANETLTAVKESKVALEAAAAEAATKGKTKAQARELGKAISHALNATAQAQARLDATAAVLDAVQQEKTSELLGIVAQLAQEDEEEEREAEAKAAHESLRVGRKQGLGGEGGSAAAGAAAGAGGSSTGGSSGSGNATAGGKPRAEVREALKQAAAAGSSGNVSGLNVTAVAQAAIDASAQVVASSKEKVEETIEKKKPKVSERAIEIAKELVQEGDASQAAASARAGVAAASNATATSGGAATVSVIEVAATKHGQRANSTQQRTTLTVLPELGGSMKLSLLRAPAFNSQQHANVTAATRGRGDELQSSSSSSSHIGTRAASAEQGGGNDVASDGGDTR